MLKLRTKRRTAAAADALTRLNLVEASVAALGNEDLLDLADIFKQAAGTPLAEMASAEMLRRNLSL